MHSVLLWMDGQESMEAFDFAFGPVKDRDFDVDRQGFPSVQYQGVEEPVAADRWLLQRA